MIAFLKFLEVIMIVFLFVLAIPIFIAAIPFIIYLSAIFYPYNIIDRKIKEMVKINRMGDIDRSNLTLH